MFKVAGSESQAENYIDARVLWLFADACSMRLVPENSAQPFKPWFQHGAGRSAIADDFSEDELRFFAEVLPKVDRPRVRARLADLLWVRGRPRRPEDALTAIRAYSSIPLDPDTWIRDGRECYERALKLCRTLGKGARDNVDRISAALLESLSAATEEDGFHAAWIAQIVREYGLLREHHCSVASKLGELASHFENASDWWKARDYLQEIVAYANMLGAEDLKAEARIRLAKSWETQAGAHISGDQPSYLMAADCLESAVQEYRDIPRSQRESLGVNDKVDSLRRRADEYRGRSTAEMGHITSGPIDLSAMQDAARAHVTGKDAGGALLALSSVGIGPSEEKRRAAAEKSIREHPLSEMLGATYLGPDGRPVAKTPASDFGGPADDVNVRAHMVRTYVQEIGITVQGCIVPALETVKCEHQIREFDFVLLARRSPSVPPNRENMVGKALFAGFELDFAVALHLLVPQIEHFVRERLKAAGADTTRMSQEGFVEERSLSTLLQYDEALSVFGPDLLFELRALFVDRTGTALRDSVSHGLLDDASCESVYACYAWWLLLHVVCRPFVDLVVE